MSTCTIGVVIKERGSYVLRVLPSPCDEGTPPVDGDLGVFPRGMLIWKYAADGADRPLRFGGEILTKLGTPCRVQLPGPGGSRGQAMYVLLVRPQTIPSTQQTVTYTLDIGTSAKADPDDPKDWEPVQLSTKEAARDTGEIKMPP